LWGPKISFLKGATALCTTTLNLTTFSVTTLSRMTFSIIVNKMRQPV
jgi:hypothetical protein